MQTLVDQQAEIDEPGSNRNSHAPLANRDILLLNLEDSKSNGLKPLKLNGKYASIKSARARSNPRAGSHKKNTLSLAGAESKSPFAPS